MVDVKLSALAVKNIIEANDYVPIYDPDAAVGARNLLVPATALLDRAKHTGGMGGAKLTGVGHPTAAQDATTLLYDQAKLMNLFANGSGLMGTNYNMSAMTFDPVETHGGAGSFKETAATASRLNDEYIPIDPEKFYRLAVWAKAGDTGGGNFDSVNRIYLGVQLYDIDNLSISPYLYAKYPGSTDTTLAVALNPGDTTMTLVNATGWHSGTTAHARNFLWWPYANAKGYTYPNYTYSRNFSGNYRTDWSTNGWWAAGGVSGNVVTLSQPWNGPALPVGTPVRNTQSGGTYKYIAANNLLLPNAWTRYEGWIGGIDTAGTQAQNQFPYGTAYTRIVALLNYSTTLPNTTRLSDIWFSELSARNLELATPTSPGVSSAADKAKLDNLYTPTNNKGTTDVTDFNTITQSGHYNGYAAVGAPAAGNIWFHVIHNEYSGSTGTSAYSWQLATNLNTNDSQLWHRIRFANTWQPWINIGMLPAERTKLTALGSTLVATAGANVAVPASTITQIAGPLTLTPGRWLLWGFANILMGAAAGSIEVYLRSVTTVIAPPLALQLAAAAQGGGDTPPAVIDIAADTTYNLAAYSSAAATARASSGVATIAGATGLRAARIG